MADGELIIETKIETKSFDAQIQKLQADLDRYMKVLESDAKVPVSLRMSADERRELEATIERLKNQLIELKRRAGEVGDAGEEAGEKTGKGFEKGIKSLKRFGLSLFGIRSAFTLMSRASSSYLSQNEAAANKMQALWTALGNLVGPVIEMIANAILKLVGYLQVFVNALGWKIDLTKNMNKNTKAVQGTSKAMKELNKQTAGFDELNVLNDNSTNDASGGISGGTGGFEMPELDEGIVKVLEHLAEVLKENWDWIWKVGAALLGAFALSKIGSIIGGTGKGLLGLAGVLKTLATIGIITAGVNIIYNAVTGRDLINDLKEIIDWANEMKGYYEDLAKQTKKQVNDEKEWIDSKKEEVDTYEKGSQEMKLYFNQLKQTLDMKVEDTKRTAKYVDSLSGLEYWYEETKGIVDTYNDSLAANNQGMRQVIVEMARLYSQGQLTTEQEDQFYDILHAVHGELVDGEVVYKDLDNNILSASKHTENYTRVLEATGVETEKVVKGTSALGNPEIVEGVSVLGNKVTNGLEKPLENASTTVGNLARTMADKFGEISNLKAEPKVEVKTDTKNLKNLSDILEQTGMFSSGIWGNLKNKLKRFGLAKGGIVNVPGKGVPIGSAYAGEAGREGILPLTDSQAMETLGQAIGKYISLNATIPVYVGNRQVAREIKKIEAEDDFAYNG